MKEKLCSIQSCEFRRRKTSNPEFGLLLNDGFLGILDCDGKVVTKVLDWRETSDIVVNLEPFITQFMRGQYQSEGC